MLLRHKSTGFDSCMGVFGNSFGHPYILFAMSQVAYKMVEAQQAALSQPKSAPSLPDGPQTDEASAARETFSMQEHDDVGLAS